MKNKSREALDAYFVEGDSWAIDRQRQLRSSRRIAWIVAVVAAAIALFEAIALIFLTPLKTAVPYTLMVDRETGFVQKLEPLDPQLVSSRTALTKSFLVQYVIAREGYDRISLQRDYRKVALWSAGSARKRYIAAMQASNPASPLARYPHSVVEVEVKSVTPMDAGSAMVRFQTRRRGAADRLYPARDWVAVVHYTFSDEPISVSDRYINPLGFEVTRYSRSAETLPDDDDAVRPGPGAPDTTGGIR